MAARGRGSELCVELLRAAPGYTWWQTSREVHVAFEVPGMVPRDALRVRVSAQCRTASPRCQQHAATLILMHSVMRTSEIE